MFLHGEYKGIDLTRMECKVLSEVHTRFTKRKYRFNQNGM